MEPFVPATDLHQAVAVSAPAVRRGKVWCKTCGREQGGDGATWLRYGWPQCHGETMTIDHPSTWAPRPVGSF